jgi:predicted MFS family arabinose efflux permease
VFTDWHSGGGSLCVDERTKGGGEMKTGRLNETSAVSIALFLTLFASQSGLIALSPVLTKVASDLDVSAATAGQLRTITGLAAGLTALALARAARRLGLRSLMFAGAGLVGAGSVASSVAPGFEWLALAQVAIGIGVAVLLTSATTAAAEWVADEHRARVLSWALIGQPAAWIVGMPLIGALGELSWRYGLLAMPLLGSTLAAVALAGRPGTPPVDRKVGLGAALAQAPVARWAVAELFASAGWTGTLVYSGALFSQSYNTSSLVTGLVLAGVAGAFVAGNMAFRSLVGADDRRLIIRLSLALAVLLPVVGAIRPGLAVSAALMGTAAFLAAGRMLVGNAFGLTTAPDQRLAVMSVRAAANQFGYFLGTALAGAALAAAGYAGLGLALGGFFAVAVLPLVSVRPLRRHVRVLNPGSL